MDRGDKKERKNQGFTLVEVLIAVAILAVAVTPILSSFVTTAKVNSNARRKFTATTVAESLMESVKAFSLNDFATQCAYPSDGFTLLAGDLENGGAFSGSAAELANDGGVWQVKGTNYTVTKVGTATKFNESADGTYCFFVQNIRMAGGTYDAIVIYEKDTAKSNQTFTNSEGIEVSVEDTLGTMDIRALNYYDVTIQVFRTSNLGNYMTETPLVEITGTKADYY